MRLTSAALALLLGLAACRDVAPTNPGGRPVPVAVTASLTAEQQRVIAGMSVEVTGPGIPVPVLAVLDVAGAAVNGTVTVPVGTDRTFTVRAYDASGVETHAGSTTTSVGPGSNPPVAIRLQPRSGGVPVVVTVDGVTLTLSAGGATLSAGGAPVTIAASVTDAGAPVTTGVVEWGALDPALLAIAPSADGRSASVTGLGAGTTVLVARFGAVAAAVAVTIDPAQ